MSSVARELVTNCRSSRGHVFQDPSSVSENLTTGFQSPFIIQKPQQIKAYQNRCFDGQGEFAKNTASVTTKDDDECRKPFDILAPFLPQEFFVLPNVTDKSPKGDSNREDNVEDSGKYDIVGLFQEDC
ncbi:hypothetical protein BGX28_001258 [Mortierella sp. GBA30]|nr:hypothetical protein BGX28_001258 [Mortierella sp. GBA30]